MNKEANIYVVFFIIMTYNASSAEAKLILHTEVTNAIRQYFKSDCVFLIHVGLKDGALILSIAKKFGRLGVATGLLEVQEIFLNNKRIHSRCQRPLYAIVSVNQHLIISLKSITRTRQYGSTWLLLLENVKVEKVFKDSIIPLDCEFLVAQRVDSDEVHLVELYSVAAHLPLQLHVFGSWSLKRGLTAPADGLYTRRSNLQGIVFKTTNVHVPPISTVYAVNNTVTLGGLCGKLWSILEKKMNFSSIHSIAPTKSNSWDNMIDMVSREEVDLASTYTPMTLERADVVDFTIPLVTMTFKVYLQEPSVREVVWSDILSPFSAGLWMTFVFSSLVMAALLALLDQLAQRIGVDEERFTIYESLFLVFGATFCVQGQSQSPRTVSARIIYFVMYMTGIITLSSYSGVITSSLTIYRPQMPFNTLEELSNNLVYNLGVLNNTIPHRLLKLSATATGKKLYDRHIARNQSNLLETYQEGLRRTCDSKFAFIALAESASALSFDLNCTVTTLATHFSKFGASLAFPKMSPYRGLFNHNLLKLIEGGILTDLHNIVLRTKLPSKSNEVPSVSLEAVAPSLSLVAGGLILALVCLAAEAVFVSQRQLFRI